VIVVGRKKQVFMSLERVKGIGTFRAQFKSEWGAILKKTKRPA